MLNEQKIIKREKVSQICNLVMDYDLSACINDSDEMITIARLCDGYPEVFGELETDEKPYYGDGDLVHYQDVIDLTDAGDYRVYNLPTKAFEYVNNVLDDVIYGETPRNEVKERVDECIEKAASEEAVQMYERLIVENNRCPFEFDDAAKETIVAAIKKFLKRDLEWQLFEVADWKFVKVYDEEHDEYKDEYIYYDDYIDKYLTINGYEKKDTEIAG